MGTLRVASVALVAVVIVCAWAVDVRAQLIDGPTGAVGGVLGGRRPVSPSGTSQTFDLTFDFGGGYDHDPTIFRTGSVGQDELADVSSWFAGTTAASMRYRAGSTRRSVTARGRTFFNYQTTVNDSLIGAEGALTAASAFGRRQENQFTLDLQTSYEPRWVIGLLQGPEPGGAASPSLDIAPPTGVFEQRWLDLWGSAGYRRQWNRRHLSLVTYSRRRLEPVVGTGLASTFQRASFDHTRTMGRAVSLVAGYRFDENSQRDGDTGTFPAVRYQTADAGLRFTRQFSSIRRYSLSIRGGVTSVFETDATRSIDTLYPSVTLLAEIVPSRRLNLTMRYSKSVGVMAGVSALPLADDTAEVNVGGALSRRLEYAVRASFSRAEFLAPNLNRSASADAVGANAELRYAIAQWAAIFGTYAYYHHRIDDETLVGGFPSRYDRHSARIGVTFWLPVYGSF